MKEYSHKEAVDFVLKKIEEEFKRFPQVFRHSSVEVITEVILEFHRQYLEKENWWNGPKRKKKKRR